MPVFFILVFLAAALLWFSSSKWFRFFGDIGFTLWKDVKDAVSSEEDNKNKEEQETNE